MFIPMQKFIKKHDIIDLFYLLSVLIMIMGIYAGQVINLFISGILLLLVVYYDDRLFKD